MERRDISWEIKWAGLRNGWHVRSKGEVEKELPVSFRYQRKLWRLLQQSSVISAFSH